MLFSQMSSGCSAWTLCDLEFPDEQMAVANNSELYQAPSEHGRCPDQNTDFETNCCQFDNRESSMRWFMEFSCRLALQLTLAARKPSTGVLQPQMLRYNIPLSVSLRL